MGCGRSPGYQLSLTTAKPSWPRGRGCFCGAAAFGLRRLRRSRVRFGCISLQGSLLPVGVLVLAGVAILLLNIRRVNERLEGSLE